MITVEQVLANSHKVSDKYRVYFLLDGETIVYVGISKSINERFLIHKHNKTFDGFSIFDIGDECDAKEVESEIIFSMKPKYNKQITCLNRFEMTKNKPDCDFFYVSQDGLCGFSERFYIRSKCPVEFELIPFKPEIK